MVKVTVTQIKLPENAEELCDWIADNWERIPVRECVAGKWGSYYLSELPPNIALRHALRFLAEGRVPHVVLDEEESDDT